jgi:hypothetical protein
MRGASGVVWARMTPLQGPRGRTFVVNDVRIGARVILVGCDSCEWVVGLRDWKGQPGRALRSGRASSKQHMRSEGHSFGWWGFGHTEEHPENGAAI